MLMNGHILMACGRRRKSWTQGVDVEDLSAARQYLVCSSAEEKRTREWCYLQVQMHVYRAIKAAWSTCPHTILAHCSFAGVLRPSPVSQTLDHLPGLGPHSDTISVLGSSLSRMRWVLYTLHAVTHPARSKVIASRLREAGEAPEFWGCKKPPGSRRPPCSAHLPRFHLPSEIYPWHCSTTLRQHQGLQLAIVGLH